MSDSPKPDMAKFRAAVQLRDRCRRMAMAHYERSGLTPSVAYANVTFDAIVDLIREDERQRGAQVNPVSDLDD